MPPGQRPQDAWKGNNATPAGPARLRKKSASARPWFGAAFFLLAILGVIAAWLYYIRPDPVPVLLAVPVVHTEQSSDWPPNPWAEADAKAVRERFDEASAKAVQSQQKGRLLADLRAYAEASRGDHKGRPLVVSVSALGVVADGKVYLIPADGLPDDPGTWLTLDELLDPLRQTDGHRLLILDVRPVVNASRAAVPTEDVNEALDATLARLAADSNLPFLVLTANTPCDGPNLLRPLGRSVFSLAVSRGLGGAADGWGGEKDQKVWARELGTYVREVTARVSGAAGLTPQVPRMHGSDSAKDFALFGIPAGGVPPFPEPVAAPTYPPWLLDGWQTRDKWAAPPDPLHRRAPRVANHLNRLALRAERRWLGGLDPSWIQERYSPDAAKVVAVVGELSPVKLPARSVARVRGKPGVDVATAEKNLGKAFGLIENPNPPTKDDKKDGAISPELKAAVAEARGKAGDADLSDATAVALLKFARGLENPTHEQLRGVAAVAAEYRLKHVEFRVIELVAALPADRVNKWPPGTTRVLLEVAQTAEDATAADGRVLLQLTPHLAAADRTRREALRVLCDTDKTDRPAAVGRLKELPGVYQAIRRVADELTAAWIEYEDTRAVLTDLAVCFPGGPLPVQKAFATGCVDLVEKYRHLEQVIAVPTGVEGAGTTPAALPDPAAIARTAQSVRTARLHLLGMIQHPPPGAGPKAIEQALLWPGWSAAERMMLVGRLDEAGKAAAARARDNWPDVSDGRGPSQTPACSTAVAESSARELRTVIEVLSLADPAGMQDLRAKANRFGPTPNIVDVTAAARATRKYWRGTLPENYRTGKLADRDRYGWLVDPDDVAAFPRPGTNFPPNPELPRRRDDERAFLAWLAKHRYLADAAELRMIDVTDYPVHQKAFRAYAEGLDGVAREIQEWAP